jgi:hypothetical protein
LNRRDESTCCGRGVKLNDFQLGVELHDASI